MEEKNVMCSGEETPPGVSETSILLTHFIGAEEETLRGLLRSYVSRSGIASTDEEVQDKAAELLHEVYIAVSKTSHRFDSTRSPQAWLLGIAGRILRQKRYEFYQLRQHEVVLSDLQWHDHSSCEPDGDPLDRLSMLYAKEYEEEREMREEVQYLLSLVSEKDRSLLELCYLHGLDGNALALELKCSCIAVHKRLYRARQRIRTALTRAERRAL